MVPGCVARGVKPLSDAIRTGVRLNLDCSLSGFCEPGVAVGSSGGGAGTSHPDATTAISTHARHSMIKRFIT
jgi:hypothetical protein